MPRVLVDMSCTLLHHGHIRLLRKASELGRVIVGLTTDEEILAHKGYIPELRFEHRREILMAIKYVSEVLPSPWLINDDYLSGHNIDLLVHGEDNSNAVDMVSLVLFERTADISSTILRERASDVLSKQGRL